MDIEILINKFQNSFGYIEEIETIIEFLEKNNFSLTEINKILHRILEYNETKEQELRKDLNKKKELITKQTKKEKEEEKNEPEITFKTKILNTEYYKHLIDTCEDMDFITEVLPSSYESNFEDIIYSLLLTIYKEIVCANQMLELTKDKKEMEYLQEEIKNNKQKINIIKDYYKEVTFEENKVIDKIEDNKSNTIFYLRNQSNNPYINIDINDIDISDLPYIKTILQELEHDTITNEKRFVSYEDLKGISAIRKGNVRVIFTRIDNSIIILGTLAKRFQNTVIYRELLRRRAKVFREQKDAIKLNINNEDYIKENNKITKVLIDKLTPTSSKAKIKKEA